jgi:diguanylate cyclase (GGDEF)-like protein
MERILIVEDDSFFREVFSALLKEDGYVVDVASSGEQALNMMNHGDYQLVVTDLVMKDVSGLDILAKVKQQDSTVDVIVVTGHANAATAIFALKNGARDYLIKPINHEEFKLTVAKCMEQRRLLDENQELKELVNLFRVSQTIANCLDFDHIYALILDALAKEAGTGRGLGYFYDGSDNLSLREIKGFPETVGAKLGEMILARCNAWETETASYRVLNDVLPAGHDFGPETCGDIKDALVLFVRYKSILQGVVVLFGEPVEGFFNGTNFKNISFLIDQSSLALDNAARYSIAKNLLYIDELTGLFNYRYLDIALDREIRRAERYSSSLSVLFLDIDTFKKVNDQHGHLIGSKVLAEVGMLMRRSVRDVDTVIRYGGDEYTIILVETGIEGTITVAERIRSTIEGHCFVADEGLTVRLTASMGFACYPEDSKSKIELLELADKAMYRGKEDGKNRVFYMPARKAGL